VENRCRLTLEVLAALCTVYPAGCVGVRFSPASTFDDMHDSNPKETFTYIISQADKLGLSYIHTVDPRIKGNDEGGDAATGLDATYWRSVAPNTPLLAAGGLTSESAESYLVEGHADAVVFGRHFISNPDLPFRLINGLKLTDYDRDTFYGGAEAGYVDYPYYNDEPANNERMLEPLQEGVAASS